MMKTFKESVMDEEKVDISEEDIQTEDTVVQDNDVDGADEVVKDKKEGKGFFKSSKEKMIKIKESEHQKLVDDLAEEKDKYIRLYAEFDNVRKRVERERADFVKYASEELIVEFLDILDNLERSVDAAVKVKKDEDTSFIKGLEMVVSHLYDMLKKNGVRVIEPKGKKFDHNCHEVMMKEESSEVDNDYIIEEFQKGYYLYDKVVRTAKVKIAINLSSETTDASGDEDLQENSESTEETKTA